MTRENMHFVFQYNTHAERSPMFTADQRFNITRNNYRQGINQLTLTGLRNAYGQGEAFKDVYTNHHKGFLSQIYNPGEFFIRTYPDNPSAMSAYAFVLGTDPDHVEGLGLVQEKGLIAPLSNAHIDDARKALYLDRAVSRAKPAYVYSGNSDGFFFRDVNSMYPGLQKDFDKNMDTASQEYSYKTGGKLFSRMSNIMNVGKGDINFRNLAKYLDDYICAYSNEKSTYPFVLDEETQSMISDYYVFLIDRGLLRDPALNKVIAHPFLYSLLREILFKAQPEFELDKWEGPCVTSKVSLAFGNRLTYLAALKVLNINENVIYNPGWGDQLTFELFEENDEWYVRIFNNNKLVTLDSCDSNIKLQDFKDYVCSRLYYGNMDAVESGHEDYHAISNIQGGRCSSLTQIVPLFGCKKKVEFNREQRKQNEYGWTQDELRNQDQMTKYGSRGSNVDDSLIFIGESVSPTFGVSRFLGNNNNNNNNNKNTNTNTNTNSNTNSNRHRRFKTYNSDGSKGSSETVQSSSSSSNSNNNSNVNVNRNKNKDRRAKENKEKRWVHNGLGG